MQITPPDGAREILRLLTDAGHEAYLVGGCVRDALRGALPHDWDIATSASPQAVKAALGRVRTIDTGLRHGTISALLSDLYEITTLRGAPTQDTPRARLLADLSLRDFTINAMACTPQGELIDAFGGQADLRAGIVRCVGSAEARFAEDSIRVLRALRFCSALGFAPDSATLRALNACAPRLAEAAGERVGAELRALLLGRDAPRVLNDHPLPLCAAVPGLTADSLALTARALAHADAPDFPAGWADEVTRLSLLLHACDARAAMRRLKQSNPLTDAVAQLAAHADAPLIPTRPEARRWLSAMPSRQLFRLMKLQACLAFAQTGEVPASLAAFRSAVDEALHSPAACTLGDLAVGGRDLLALGVPPGKAIGRMLERLLEDVMDERVDNAREALLALASALLKDANNA